LKKKSWVNIPEGGLIIEPGNSVNFKTGDWKSFSPSHNKKKCINCLLCFIQCPDDAIKTKDGKITHIDYNYCKGCGICAEICPVKAIKMTEVCKNASN